MANGEDGRSHGNRVFSAEHDFEPILRTGEVGYIHTGIKSLKETKVGDTVTLDADPCDEALEGYKEIKSMVFSGLYPMEADDYTSLREALEKLQLNDSAFSFEPETSAALGFGFRCGFLGLLHMEVIQERLEREYSMGLITTMPNVEYKIVMKQGGTVTVDNPADYPEVGGYRAGSRALCKDGDHRPQ